MQDGRKLSGSGQRSSTQWKARENIYTQVVLLFVWRGKSTVLDPVKYLLMANFLCSRKGGYGLSCGLFFFFFFFAELNDGCQDTRLEKLEDSRMTS